jgi:hypothetical protein
MEEEFVPYELALRLKELGFDKSTFGGWCHPFNNHKPYLQLNQEGEYDITAPTFSQAFRWFREKYKLSHIWMIDKILDTGNFTYYESEIVCLKDLIEIIKNKSK